MAKRSDFAQKLLDDLRLRKERMGAVQSANHTNATATDAYANSKQTYRGSKETKTRATTGSRTGSTYNRPHGRNRSISIEEASTHIVPYGRGQNSAQIGDLSMALAFAFENGGKLGRMDSSSNNISMMNFLHQIGRGSVEFSKFERRGTVDRHQSSTTRFPTLSHLHIKEISKGAQKLNQILKACSSGHNFDRYSVEMGKQLLKGAIDLEESLRMLVNMQEASEYMISPQRKSRITLLEDDDDNGDDTVMTTEQRQLDLPMFSFDKPSRNSHAIEAVSRRGVKQQLNDSNHEKQALVTSNSVSHVRRASYGPDVKTIGTSTKPKPEKGRIPSVIVKLMGLDELPENIDQKHTIQRDSSFNRNVEKKNKDTQNLAQQPVKQKVIMQPHKSPVHQDTASRYSNFEVVLQDRKSLLKDLPSSTEKIKQHSNIALLNRNTGRQMDVTEKERKQDNTKQREQNGTEKSKTKEPAVKDELQQKRAESVVIQKKTEYKASKLHLQSQQKPHILRKSEPQEEKEEQHAIQKMQVRNQRGNEVMSKVLSERKQDAIYLRKKQQHINQVKPSKKGPRELNDRMPPKWFQENRHHTDFAKEGSSLSSHISTKGSTKRNTDQNSSMKYSKSELDGASPFAKEILVHVPVTQKAKNMEVDEGEIPCQMDEVMRRRNGSLNNSTESLKYQNSTLQERKHEIVGGPRRAEQVRDKPNKPEAHITKSNESEASIQPPNMPHELQKESDRTSTLHGHVGDEYLSLKEQETEAPIDSSQRITQIAIKDRQGQANNLGGKEHKFDAVLSNTIDKTGGGKNIAYPLELKHKKFSKTAMQEQLTERENHLKQILMRSQLFLDTAEALLKLNISFVILNVGDQDCLDEDDKLVLDCGYELMKRKGTKQELSVHPYVTISIASTKIISLDDLVKQLDKDFEVFKLYGKNGKSECKVEDYVPKMLESDVYDRYPDLNCMWDAGWDENMLAFLEKDDVIRDVERHVFNRLIDDIVQDLLST